MVKKFKITLAQLNPTVGDLDGNYEAAVKAVSYTHLTLTTIRSV